MGYSRRGEIRITRDEYHSNKYKRPLGYGNTYRAVVYYDEYGDIIQEMTYTEEYLNRGRRSRSDSSVDYERAKMRAEAERQRAEYEYAKRRALNMVTKDMNNYLAENYPYSDDAVVIMSQLFNLSEEMSGLENDKIGFSSNDPEYIIANKRLEIVAELTLERAKQLKAKNANWYEIETVQQTVKQARKYSGKWSMIKILVFVVLFYLALMLFIF